MRERSHNTVPQFVISIIHVNMSYRDILKLFMRERNHISTQCVISIKVVLNKHIEDVHEGTKPHKSQMFNL